ncbi:hypothetical protein DFH09DRAFT_1202729 [Mycena vulgaris]|nr:hypothetical protein DFH09DRAFT_1202729 [Mycena vulgaris]
MARGRGGVVGALDFFCRGLALMLGFCGRTRAAGVSRARRSGARRSGTSRRTSATRGLGGRAGSRGRARGGQL